MAKPPSKSQTAARKAVHHDAMRESSPKDNHMSATRTKPTKDSTKSAIYKQKQHSRAKSQKIPKGKMFLRSLSARYQALRQKRRDFRKDGVKLHKTFRRSYREDYIRETNTPGLLTHAMTTFQIFFKHWKTFVPFILLMVAAYTVLVGLMSEEVYQQFQDSINQSAEDLANGQMGNFARAVLLLTSTITTGGLDSGMGDEQVVFMLFLFLVMWMVTIYLVRHFMAGGRPKLRDGLYNALGPLISVIVVFLVIFIQAIPLMLVLITYSAAVQTGFLSTPFYALAYFLFAATMLLITSYLWSSSLMALVAVTAPGVYPMKAIFAASDMMAGRRTKMIIRVIYLLIVVALIFVIVMTPIILIDLWLKNTFETLYGVPIVSFALLLTTCFVFIYATIYLYRYYRWLLDYPDKEDMVLR